MCLLKIIQRTSVFVGLSLSICTPYRLLGEYTKELLEKDIKAFYENDKASHLMQLALDCTYDDILDGRRFESFLSQLETCDLKPLAQFLRDMPDSVALKNDPSDTNKIMLPEKTEDAIRSFLSTFEEQEDFKQSGIAISEDLIKELCELYNKKVKTVNGGSSSEFSNIDKKVHTYMKALSQNVMPPKFYDILHSILRAHLEEFANPKDPNFSDYLIDLNTNLKTIFDHSKEEVQKEWDKIVKSVNDYKTMLVNKKGLGIVEFLQEMGNVFCYSHLDQYHNVKSLPGNFNRESNFSWVDFRAILSNLIDYEIKSMQKDTNFDEFFSFKTIDELINHLEEVNQLIFGPFLYEKDRFLAILKQVKPQENEFISFMNSLFLSKKQQKENVNKIFVLGSQSNHISANLEKIKTKEPTEKDKKQKGMKFPFAKKKEQQDAETREQQKSILIETHNKIAETAKSLKKLNRSCEDRCIWMFIFDLVNNHVNL